MPFLLVLSGFAAVIIIMNKTAATPVPKSKAEFFTLLRPVALAVERETGIKADLGMVQAALESAYGTSGLTQKARNLFGFTAELGTYWRTQGKAFVEMPTTEYGVGGNVKLTRPFRSYTSWDESYRDWARLMQTPNYAKALPLAKAGNLKGFAAALQAAGYATDPAYASKLEGVARAAGIA
jgi:flagellar protein FlgJ